ncbi:MAG: hypothetical protein ACE5KH_02365 [Candidatus Geothermarchaeales archaeon]
MTIRSTGKKVGSSGRTAVRTLDKHVYRRHEEVVVREEATRLLETVPGSQADALIISEEFRATLTSKERAKVDLLVSWFRRKTEHWVYAIPPKSSVLSLETLMKDGGSEGRWKKKGLRWVWRTS